MLEGTPVQAVAGMLVSATVLLATDWLLVAYANPSYGGWNAFTILRISMIPIIVIGLGSFVRLPKAFGLTVIFAGLGGW